MASMESSGRRIWFPAKRYGWGWGLPVAWQGWLVLLLYAAGLFVALKWLPPAIEPLRYGLCVGVLTAVLLVVCWVKGEPPRWRWGKDE